jgi:hypothetical protein
MSYVIYHKETTKFLRIFRNGYWQDAKYASEAAAKAGLTRAVKKGKVKREDYAIEEAVTFHRHIEKQETRRNLLSGTEFTQPVNTPACCDPSTETYWSM